MIKNNMKGLFMRDWIGRLLVVVGIVLLVTRCNGMDVLNADNITHYFVLTRSPDDSAGGGWLALLHSAGCAYGGGM